MIGRACVLLAVLLWGPATAQDYGPARDQIDPAACTEVTGGWTERAVTRSLSPMAGLPATPHPAENPPTPEKIELGRKLFFDRRLSINKTMSCAMCHIPEQGFANWELQTAVGVEGRGVKRNAPTLLNVGTLNVLFHDGRDLALETQFVGPMVAHNEMANPSVGLVVAFLKQEPAYRRMFDAAFAAPPSLDRIGAALAVYQRTLVAGNSPFDRWHYEQDATALSPAQQRGYELFTGKANCAGCHPIGAGAALFTDQLFHDTGYGWMREQQRQAPPATTRVQAAPGIFYDLPRALIKSVSTPRAADLGRYEVTEDPADRWKIRTPSLRNVAMTRPYMHDGGLPTLEAVIGFYNRGGAGHAGQDPRIRPLGLTAGEIADLAAFLNGLTAPNLACLVAEARSAIPDNP